MVACECGDREQLLDDWREHIGSKPRSDPGVEFSHILEQVERSPSLRLVMNRIADPASALGRFLLTGVDHVFIRESLTEPTPDGVRSGQATGSVLDLCSIGRKN